MPRQRGGLAAELNSPPQNADVDCCSLVAKGPTLLPSTACKWELHMASAVMGICTFRCAWPWLAQETEKVFKRCVVLALRSVI